jgi:hypothetical protein
LHHVGMCLIGCTGYSQGHSRAVETHREPLVKDLAHRTPVFCADTPARELYPRHRFGLVYTGEAKAAAIPDTCNLRVGVSK